ncbi:hypothetical protein Dimus_014539 [Dionaea muscipula]
MLLLYYAFLKQSDRTLLITINSFGCIVQSTYLTIYMIYATKQSKIHTGRLLFLFNLVAFGLITLLTMLFCKEERRVAVVGWICGVFSLCVFAAPLSVMRMVIRTKSVEFMPFGLSLTLTLSAVTWFFYGFFIKDFFIAVPNVMGFLLGLAQMILYITYRDRKKKPAAGILPETKLGDLPIEIKLGTFHEADNKTKVASVHVEPAAAVGVPNV